MSSIENNFTGSFQTDHLHQPNDRFLEESFDAFWDDLPERFTERKTPEDKRDMLECERLFVQNVLGEIARLAESRESGPITVLFDLDETLVKNVYGEKDELTTYVRPGFGALMRELDLSFGERVDIGFLTSRAQEHLEEEMREPTYSKVAAGKINHDFVISSHRRGGHDLISRGGELEDIPRESVFGEEVLRVAVIQEIIDPQLKAFITDEGEPVIMRRVFQRNWYDPKLAILQHIAKKHPERGFVIVDDLSFPDTINSEHPQVRGVSLGDARFTI